MREVKEMVRARQAIDEARPQHPVLTREGEVELARRVARGGSVGEAARRDLVEANQGLVITIARRFVDRGLPLPDLIQEGNLGLLKAVDRFNYRLGYRFSTYATWWIWQAMGRALSNKARTIRIPVHVLEETKKLVETTRRIAQETGADASLIRAADELRLPRKRLYQLLAVPRGTLSLDASLRGQEDRTLEDVIADPSSEPPDDLVASRELSARASRLLETLNEREHTIIRLRFGIGTARPHTLAEIGDELGVSRERVRQIESQVLEKLRRARGSEILKSYLDLGLPSRAEGPH
jgi:RNA polymerase sigma factor (sigma-70 family)